MRINIDEKWKTDPRRKFLAKRLGSERLADGMLIEITWILISHRGKDLPLAEFKFIENHEDWIACGLGHINGDWVHISGSDRYQEFFDKQSQNASRPRGHKPKSSQTEPNLAKSSQTEPNQPSSSSSSSSSSSKTNTAGEERSAEPARTPPAISAEQFSIVLPELAGNSKRDEVLSQVPIEIQMEWVDRYDLSWLKASILHAVAHYTKTEKVDQVFHWEEKLVRWFKNEKKSKFKTRAPPGTVKELPRAWETGKAKALADPEIQKNLRKVKSRGLGAS